MSDLADIEMQILIELAKHEPGERVLESTLRSAIGLDIDPGDRHKFLHHMGQLQLAMVIDRRFNGVCLNADGRRLLISQNLI